MKSVVTAVAIGLFSILAMSCKEKASNLCCTSAADCAEVDLPDITECTNGLRCSGNVCVNADCQTDVDCPGASPVCIEKLCYQCDETHACATGACVDRMCVECDDATPCDQGVCVDNRCSGCEVDEDCDASAPVCNVATNSCEGCSVLADCAAYATTPLCNAASGACVACLDDAQCSGVTPVCDLTTSACRGCTLDAECASGACDENGSCVPEANILYIALSGPFDPACTRTQPCAWGISLEQSLSQTRNHVVFENGLHTGNNLTIIGATAPTRTYLHGHGAVLQQNVSSPRVFLDAARSVTARDLTFGANTEVSFRNGDSVFHSVKFVGANFVRVTSGKLTADDLLVRGNSNPEGAVLVQAAGELEVSVGMIDDVNIGIAATEAGARVTLENVMVKNARGLGLKLDLASGSVRSSTIARTGTNLSAAPCAVSCSNLLSVSSSIIWQPMCGGVVRDAVGSCPITSSIISNAFVPAGSSNTNPLFVNEALADLHLSPMSPAKDAVSSGPMFDFEGDPRPRGAAFDIGADEVP